VREVSRRHKEREGNLNGSERKGRTPRQKKKPELWIRPGPTVRPEDRRTITKRERERSGNPKKKREGM